MPLFGRRPNAEKPKRVKETYWTLQGRKATRWVDGLTEQDLLGLPSESALPSEAATNVPLSPEEALKGGSDPPFKPLRFGALR